MLRRLCALSLPCRASPWGRATGDGHHPFIRLHHTGRAHPARLKRDAHLQGAARSVCSTSHAGLLAPMASGAPEAAWVAGEPPKTRLHSWGAVVSVEYSSRTLPAYLPLCRKCTDTALRCTIFCRVEDGFVHVSCLQPFVQDGFLHRNMAQQPGVTDFVKGFDNLLPLSTTHSLTPQSS